MSRLGFSSACLSLLVGGWGCSEGNDSSPVSAPDDDADSQNEMDASAPSSEDAGADEADDDTEDLSDPSQCTAGEASRFAPPTPSPLISLEQPVFASEGAENAAALVDGNYRGDAVILPAPTEESSPWVAVQLEEGPTELLVIWRGTVAARYNNPGLGTPLGYRFETSSDSTDGADGSWQTIDAAAVTDNTLTNAGHRIAFEGQTWLRMVITEARPTDDDIRLDELSIYDMSDVEPGQEDTWLFFGDSITLGAFARDFTESLQFDQKVTENVPDRHPAFINAGIGGETLGDALDRLDEVLMQYPDFRQFAVAFGTNDAWGNHDPIRIGFDTRLAELVERLIAADRVPILARIPYATAAHSTLREFNAIIDQVQAEYQLPCGPDLYTLTLETPRLLQADGVHLIQQGNIQLNEQWANAALAFYGVER